MASAGPAASGSVGPTGSGGTRKAAASELPGSSGTSQTMKKTIGHRGVDPTGETTYKKTTSSALKGAIQLGITHTVGSLSQKAERDVLMQDFVVVESIFFPSEGSNLTPAHRYSDFRFKTYAPIAFRYFRELFGIRPDDYLYSLCNESLIELSNPGASGSVFYVSADDEFIIKTVQHKEAEFLQKLLPGYFMNLNQNKRTLLPKFYGLYCVQAGGKNIRIVVMNNLLPRSVHMHLKYDLKGSTYKRRASAKEREKASPTSGGIPARNVKGERLSVYIGIIDILQSYRFMKKLEHSWKALVHDGDTVSVHRPGFYAERFQKFMCNTVFKKIPRASGSGLDTRLGYHSQLSQSEAETDSGMQLGRPDLLPRTPPMDEAVCDSIDTTLSNCSLGSTGLGLGSTSLLVRSVGVEVHKSAGQYHSTTYSAEAGTLEEQSGREDVISLKDIETNL
ncbi:hypothetical protein JZ751_000135 [Albula glossodonta]|uniref:PIPK domain-containing protein n=1 Tax=Albula glossodonta TaxID=121402 RepID=A0A8T2PV12_9TELE|nr:hypothetical protein JZ751_000135 [Albula glossodonta]